MHRGLPVPSGGCAFGPSLEDVQLTSDKPTPPIYSTLDSSGCSTGRRSSWVAKHPQQRSGAYLHTGTHASYLHYSICEDSSSLPVFSSSSCSHIEVAPLRNITASSFVSPSPILRHLDPFVRGRLARMFIMNPINQLSFSFTDSVVLPVSSSNVSYARQ